MHKTLYNPKETTQQREAVTADELSALQARLEALHAARLLTDGYGFGSDDATIEFVGNIDGIEVELHRSYA